MATAEALQSLERKAFQADNNIVDIFKQLKVIRRRLKKHDARFDGIDKRLDNVDGRLNGVDGRLDNIDGRLNGVDGRLDNIDGRLNGVESQLTAHGMSLDAIEGRLNGVERVQSSSLVKLEAMDEKLRDIDLTLRLVGDRQQLEDQEVALGRLTAMVDAHTGILTEHTEVLSALVGTTQRHGVRFDRVDSRFDVVDRTLASINEKLDGALSA